MEEDFDMPQAEEMSEDFDLPDDSPILKVGEEKEIGKHGLKKKLLKEGEGLNYPEVGDEVEGTYILNNPINPSFLISGFSFFFFTFFFSFF